MYKNTETTKVSLLEQVMTYISALGGLILARVITCVIMATLTNRLMIQFLPEFVEQYNIDVFTLCVVYALCWYLITNTSRAIRTPK